MSNRETGIGPVDKHTAKKAAISSSRAIHTEISGIFHDPVLAWADAVSQYDIPVTNERADEIRSQIRVGMYDDSRRKGYQIHERIGYFHIQPLDAYFLSDAPREHIGNGFDKDIDIVVPVGEYGPDIAYAVAATAVLFRDRLMASMYDLSDETDRQHRALLRKETFRGTRNGKATLNVLGNATLTMGTLGLLFAEKLEGFPTDKELLDAVIDQRFLTKLAKLSPSGVVEPLILSGSYIEGMIQGNNGTLEIQDSVLATLAELRRENIPLNQPQDRSWGCPGTHTPKVTEEPWLTPFTDTFAVGVRDFLSRGTPDDLREKVERITHR